MVSIMFNVIDKALIKVCEHAIDEYDDQSATNALVNPIQAMNLDRPAMKAVESYLQAM